jgi:hypothetical protein
MRTCSFFTDNNVDLWPVKKKAHSLKPELADRYFPYASFFVLSEIFSRRATVPTPQDLLLHFDV